MIFLHGRSIISVGELQLQYMLCLSKEFEAIKIENIFYHFVIDENIKNFIHNLFWNKNLNFEARFSTTLMPIQLDNTLSYLSIAENTKTCKEFFLNQYFDCGTRLSTNLTIIRLENILSYLSIAENFETCNESCKTKILFLWHDFQQIWNWFRLLQIFFFELDNFWKCWQFCKVTLNFFWKLRFNEKSL